MDWLTQNAQLLFTLVTLVVVAGVWGYVRYWRDQDRLRRDLEALVRDGLEYLKQWAKGQLESVTTEDIARVSNLLYDQYVAGTELAKFVTREQLYSLLLQAFVAWRDKFRDMAQALVVRKGR